MAGQPASARSCSSGRGWWSAAQRDGGDAGQGQQDGSAQGQDAGSRRWRRRPVGTSRPGTLKTMRRSVAAVACSRSSKLTDTRLGSWCARTQQVPSPIRRLLTLSKVIVPGSWASARPAGRYRSGNSGGSGLRVAVASLLPTPASSRRGWSGRSLSGPTADRLGSGTHACAVAPGGSTVQCTAAPASALVRRLDVQEHRDALLSLVSETQAQVAVGRHTLAVQASLERGKASTGVAADSRSERPWRDPAATSAHGRRRPIVNRGARRHRQQVRLEGSPGAPYSGQSLALRPAPGDFLGTR